MRARYKTHSLGLLVRPVRLGIVSVASGMGFSAMSRSIGAINKDYALGKIKHNMFYATLHNR